MKTSVALLTIFHSICVVVDAQQQTTGDYPITPIPFSQVKLTDDFWSSRIRINHEVTIPIALEQSEETGRIDNFRRAAGLESGPFASKYPFDDSDVYKILEAASYSLQTFPDPKLDAKIDTLIDIISKAQEPDGYLYTCRTITKGNPEKGTPQEWIGDKRWVNVNELSHELYNLGHLFEAASAHYLATGKRTLLTVALKAADLICDTFGPGKLENYPGHQEVEIGLVKLYRITGEKKYLDLAKFFLDERGKEGIGRPDPYNQSHVPVTEQTEAVGHAVRAAYMWTAMADVAAITGDQEYITAIKCLWHDVIYTKYYINGGIGAIPDHEGFGAPYELPNMTAYNETCAGVGNATWNHRMFLMTGNAKYIDVLERTMYNNIADGVSCSGNRFFYPNPLASEGQYERKAWFGCACCPPNVARFLPSMPGYIYAEKGNSVYVNLYISSETMVKLDSGDLTLRMQSGLPWDGDVRIALSCQKPVDATILLRVPGWAREKPTPGDLYRYRDKAWVFRGAWTNAVKIELFVDSLGYAPIKWKWQNGDTICVKFDLQPRIVVANKKVVDDRDKIAIERGPLLYCAEWPDNGSVNDLVIDQQPKLNTRFQKNLLGGIVMITTEARRMIQSADGMTHLSSPVPLTLIPYCLWDNRGAGEMEVWLPVSKDALQGSD